MGLYADGADPFAHDATAVAALMAPAVAAWFDGHIQIIDPASSTTTEYDPVTDSGGESTPVVLWDSGPRGALVQPIRAVSLGDFGSQAAALVAVRVQAAVPPTVDLRSGLQVKVLASVDAESMRHTYVIGTGVDSSLRFVTRMHCEVLT